MRRALLAIVMGVVAWRFVSGRRGVGNEVVVGWADGSSVSLDDGAPERDRIVAIAAKVMR